VFGIEREAGLCGSRFADLGTWVGDLLLELCDLMLRLGHLKRVAMRADKGAE
jgi:hypothetical protein